MRGEIRVFPYDVKLFESRRLLRYAYADRAFVPQFHLVYGSVKTVQLRDYTMIQGAVLFFAAVIVVVNLLVDMSYAWLDPRIRY